MTVRTRCFASVFLAVIALESRASADLIFSNANTGDQGITTSSSPEVAGEVTAAPGTSRVVTELDLGLTSQGVAATADIQAFLYANDGAGGSPGTLLWESAVTAISLNSTNTFVSFAVPSITVPNTFTYASSITNASPIVGYVPATGASTGTFVQAYVGSPGSWQALSSPFETEARVLTASVPEPSTYALASLFGLAMIPVWRRKRAG